MLTYILVLPDCDGLIVDSADSPEALNYILAYPYTYWEVCARYEKARNLGGPTHCLARVNLAGSRNFDSDFAYAVGVVVQALTDGHISGEFDNPDYLSDGPAIDVGYESDDVEECDDDSD